MADPTLELTSTDERLSIGTVEGLGALLLVGESLDFELEYLHLDGPPTCANVPTNFTGFTAIAEVLDSTDASIQAITVTPSAGDTTGKFAFHLDPADVTTSLMTNAVKWRFRITSGGTVNNILIYTTFTVT